MCFCGFSVVFIGLHCLFCFFGCAFLVLHCLFLCVDCFLLFGIVFLFFDLFKPMFQRKQYMDTNQDMAIIIRALEVVTAIAFSFVSNKQQTNHPPKYCDFQIRRPLGHQACGDSDALVLF